MRYEYEQEESKPGNKKQAAAKIANAAERYMKPARTRPPPELETEARASVTAYKMARPAYSDSSAAKRRGLCTCMAAKAP